MKQNEKGNFVIANKKHIIKLVRLFLVIFLLLTNTISYANVEDEEQINLQEIKEETVETAINSTEEPILNSRVALIYDRASKKILYQKNGEKQVKMASTTKILTAIVVLEKANLQDVVTINKKAAGTGGSRLGLKVNDKITVHDLLYGLMLKSGNDAAVALAVHIGGSVEEFATMMNVKAKELGCTNSHFVTPHGLDQEEHYTTAYELACMADYALNIPKFREIVGTKTYTVTINNRPMVIGNTNELLGSLIGVYGIKTGFTNGAGRCLVTSCKRGELDIITVVLGADTKKIRTQDSIKLIEYAYKNYKVINIQEIIQEKFENWKQLNENRIYINKGVEKNIISQLEKMKYTKMAVKNTEVDNIDIEISNIFYFEAPVAENTIIGTLKIKVKNEVVDTLTIANKNEIRKKQIKDYIIEFLNLIP